MQFDFSSNNTQSCTILENKQHKISRFAITGDLPKLLALYNKNNNFFTESMKKCAAREAAVANTGGKQVLLWLFKLGFEYDSMIAIAAARSGNIEVLELLYDMDLLPIYILYSVLPYYDDDDRDDMNKSIAWLKNKNFPGPAPEEEWKIKGRVWKSPIL